MRPDARLAQHALAQRLERRLGRVNIGHFVAHVVLPPGGVLRQKAGDPGIARQRLDQFDLRAVQRAIRTRRVDEAHLHALLRQVEGLMDLRRAHHVAPEHNAVRNRRRRNADMVEPAELHDQTLSITMAMP